jgi:hypothetical protein
MSSGSTNFEEELLRVHASVPSRAPTAASRRRPVVRWALLLSGGLMLILFLSAAFMTIATAARSMSTMESVDVLVNKAGVLWQVLYEAGCTPGSPLHLTPAQCQTLLSG